ncbi:MAG: hypothetical protein JXR97_13930 [Planctomycetes bacterium]|nr:hypothetical protein [Planctomycetota bacterium]
MILSILEGVCTILFLVTVLILITVPLSLNRLKSRREEIEDAFVRINENQLPPDLAEYIHNANWKGHEAYDFFGAFSYDVAKMILWKHRELDKTFAVIKAGKIHVGYETYFDDGTYLNTSASGDTTFFPPMEGQYKESFPGASSEELFEKHEESIKFLRQTKGCNIRKMKEGEDFLERMIKDEKAQLEHVCSIPLFQFRGIYWFFVTRVVRRNVSIKEQFERGLLR